MILKIMSIENLPDSDPRKNFTIIEGIRSVSSSTGDDGTKSLSLAMLDGTEMQEVKLVSNAYVMTDDGRTVSSFAAMTMLPADAIAGVRSGGVGDLPTTGSVMNV